MDTGDRRTEKIQKATRWAIACSDSKKETANARETAVTVIVLCVILPILSALAIAWLESEPEWP